MNLAALYTTQLRVLWEWRGGRKALLKRLLITLIVSTVAFLATAWLLPGIHVDRLLDGVIVVIAMALLNALVRPAVLAIVAPRSLILTAVRGDPDPDPRVPVRGQRGARRPHQRLLHGPRRLVRLRDHQHDHHRRSWASTAATRTTAC